MIINQKITLNFCFRSDLSGVYFNTYSTGKEVRVTEPPITAHLSDQEIRSFEDVPLKTEFRCNTQAVERAVKLTSAVVKKIVGTGRQNGEFLIIQKRQSDQPGRVISGKRKRAAVSE